jgi:hypothetical protein
MIRKVKAKSTAVATLGVDIGKNTFHLVGLDKRGAIVLRERLSRAQVKVRLARTVRQRQHGLASAACRRNMSVTRSRAEPESTGQFVASSKRLPT